MDEGGVEVKVFHLRKSPNSEAINEIQDAKALLVGSSTLNLGLFPTVGGFLYYLKGLKPKNKLASAFGSYGWAGGGVKEIMARLKDMELELVEPALDFKYPVTKAAGERVRRVRAQDGEASERRKIDEMDVQGLRLYTRRRGAAGGVPHVRRAEAGVQAGALGWRRKSLRGAASAQMVG